MRKIWTGVICIALVLAMTACGSGNKTDNNSQEKTEQKESAEEKQKYQEFSRFGIKFELPKGTKEEEGESGKTYYYRKESLLVMLQYHNDLTLNDSQAEKYAGGVVGSFENGELSEITKVKCDGQTGYQFDVCGTLSGIDLISTVTGFNVPVGCLSFMISNQSTDKDDYAEINDALIDSIKIDEDAFAETEEEKPTYYVEGDTAVLQDCTIKITDHKILQAGEGANAYGNNPVIVFYFDITNNSQKEITPAVEWPLCVKVIQDNDPNTVNELSPGILIGEPAADTQLDKIKVGGTVGCAISYELTDLTTPVDVYFSNTAFSQNVGSMQFKIN